MFAYVSPAKSSFLSESPLIVDVIAVAAVSVTTPCALPKVAPVVNVAPGSDANTRIVLNSGLLPTMPGAIELDVLKAVRAMLQSASGQLQVDVQSLNIESVRIADNRLSVRFDFKVAGR